MSGTSGTSGNTNQAKTSREVSGEDVICVFRLPSGQTVEQVVWRAMVCAKIARANGWHLIQVKPLPWARRRQEQGVA